MNIASQIREDNHYFCSVYVKNHSIVFTPVQEIVGIAL